MWNERAVTGIVVDAGHGGDDPGAVANGLEEKNLNLEAARYMYQRFKDLGIPVAITRDSDITLPPEERVEKVLDAFGENPNVIVLSNHMNSGGGEGAEVIYALRNVDTLARNILESIGEEGQIMRKYYQRRLPEDPSKDYYYIIRDTTPTQALLIEYGFIDNMNDAKRLEQNLINYVEAVVRAVARYAGYNYVGPNGETDNLYTVKAGDSLWSIANRYRITVDELKQANNLTSNTLQIGQVLVIPTQTTTPPSGGYINYTVKSGDTLYLLASRYGTSVQAIMDANNLQTTVLQVGQVLRIPTSQQPEPTPPSEGTIYTVKSGDSLWSIANRYNVSVDDIIRKNNLSTTTLQIGQQLIIPSGTVTSPEEPIPTPPSTTTYTVQRGDSLWSIAQRFGTTVSALQQANQLSNSSLQIGQVLVIPSTSGNNTTTYTVQRGDSLWTIAQRFGTTVNAIRNANSLTTDSLQIGQRLIIPN